MLCYFQTFLEIKTNKNAKRNVLYVEIGIKKMKGDRPVHIAHSKNSGSLFYFHIGVSKGMERY